TPVISCRRHIPSKLDKKHRTPIIHRTSEIAPARGGQLNDYVRWPFIKLTRLLHLSNNFNRFF
ncbi:MAG: hypothetical protein ACE5JB_14535, partial [bacterium]